MRRPGGIGVHRDQGREGLNQTAVSFWDSSVMGAQAGRFGVHRDQLAAMPPGRQVCGCGCVWVWVGVGAREHACVCVHVCVRAHAEDRSVSGGASLQGL